MQTALAVIEAKAVFEGDEHDISVRVGAHNDRVYVDLRDDRWRAIEISADGWRIVDEPPVRFCRTGGMRPLPEPQRGGSIDTLRPLINVKDDRDFLLIIAWLLAALARAGHIRSWRPSGRPGRRKVPSQEYCAPWSIPTKLRCARCRETTGSCSYRRSTCGCCRSITSRYCRSGSRMGYAGWQQAAGTPRARSTLIAKRRYSTPCVQSCSTASRILSCGVTWLIGRL